VKYLSTQDKKAGLETLEDLSLKIEDEMSRAKAISVILSKGIKQGRKEIDIIISMANSTPNLFDHMEETL
jgi:myo-inositol-hexaphosphate 3-phosphohydrolase